MVLLADIRLDCKKWARVFLLITTIVSFAVGKQKSWKGFLEEQAEEFASKGSVCSLKSLSFNSLSHLRITGETQKALVCYIKYLQGQENDVLAISALGDLYQKLGDAKSRTASTRVFKEAVKQGGVVTPVQQWSFIGPFTIGKLEVDGDPLAYLGGIQNVSQHRFKKKFSLPSELLIGGSVTWQQLKQKSAADPVTVSPSVNWNDLINALGSTAVTEWQGWVVGDFAFNQKDKELVIQCLGMHTVYIDGLPFVGDVYMRKNLWFAVSSLTPGIHTIAIRLRAKGIAQFSCHLKTPESAFEILPPPFLPDVYEGSLFGRYIALPIANYHASQWLKGIKVAVFSQSEGSTLDVELVCEKDFAIAPGQTAPINLKLIRSDGDEHVSDKCETIELQLKVKTSIGVGVHTLRLRCRTLRQSFLYTFLDHDGSVQRAAAIHPQQDCVNNLCPVLLTLHGTTVPPENQADSYKFKEKKSDQDYTFGAERAWLVAPSRHGAHNWEGPGALTAISAVDALAGIVSSKSWISQKLSPHHIVFAGHSMGGHGAWHLSTHFPDRALAVVSLAGWISKENYGDSNLFFRHDVSTAHADPAVKAIMEACVTENDADRHASNLKGAPVLIRIGANDRTVHPYFTRRMHRVLLEWGVNVSYSEIKNLEHWWWDTVETNDGGAVNDKQIRDFTNSLSVIPATSEGTCERSGCEDQNVAANRYKEEKESFRYTVINPAFGESYRGIKILQQEVPLVMSYVDANLEGDSISLKTVNAKRIMISEPLIRPIGWKKLLITIDGSFSARTRITNEKPLCVLKMDGQWEIQQDCDTFQTFTNRGPATYGPARRVAESKFLIVVGQSGKYQKELLLFAVYIANLFFLTSDTLAAVVKDTDLIPEEAEKHNLIIIGGPSENLLTQTYLKSIPLSVQDGNLRLGSCTFREGHSGALFLAPHAANKLALVLMSNSLPGLHDVVSLAAPTIPPMTRSPFSNLLPDFVITGPDFQSKGPGGYLCTGFWGNNWEFLPGRSSCGYC